MNPRTILITGAETAAGAHILRMLKRQVERIYVLAEVDAEVDSHENNARVCDASTAPETQPLVLRGSLSQPRLGLDERAFEAVSAEVDTIFNCAEGTVFDRDLAKARARNVEPVRCLIEMLEKARDARLVHLSTTWVCGTKRGLFTEFDLACQQGFYNAYEQSKYEAEYLLRKSSVSERVIIVRRSLTVDMSLFVHEAGVKTFESLLASLQTMPRIAVLGDSRARIDVIPVEYLAAATVALAGTSSAMGRTVHVVAGWNKSWTLGDLVERIRGRVSNSRVYYWPGPFGAAVRLIAGLSFGRLLILPRFPAALPYLRQRCVFDDYLATHLLEPVGLKCPAPETFWNDSISAPSKQESAVAASFSP